MLVYIKSGKAKNSKETKRKTHFCFSGFSHNIFI